MQLRATRLTAIASAVKRAFNIRSLFAGAVPGVWYDPSDMSTLFQDSAGTTPVTAVEQPVGLMLDKSQGLALGSEVITPEANRDFSSDTGYWSKEGGATISGGVVNVNTAVDNYPIYRFNTAPAGYFELTYTITLVTGGLRVVTGASSGTQRTASGTYTERLYNPALGTLGFRTFGPCIGTIDNVSMKAVSGNHAFQATSASRPVLSARYNLLTKTEQFYITGSPWFASGFSTSSTANNLIPSTSSVAHTWGQTAPTTVGTALVAKLWIKPNGYNTAVMQLSGCTGTPTAFFNALTGVITSQTGSPAATMVLQPDGYYECTINGVASSATPGLVSYVVALDNTTLVFAGDGTSGLLYQKASVVPANQSTLPYQRVNTATDYNTTGFLPYLRFDGVDDSLSTNSISFTSTDKMSVFAGVRKLSDATGAVIAELGPNANTGGWYLYPGNYASANGSFYTFLGRGSASENSNQAVQATPYAAPTTNVLAATGNISGDLNTLRVNTVVGTNATGDQGTGNYGNYPLYIGRRNNATLPFNGQLYSMIIVGKAVNAGELSSTETYVNSKTGAY